MRIGIRCLLLVASVLLSLCVSAQGLLNKPYHPPFNSGTIKSFIKDIEKQTGVNISFSASTIKVRRKVALAGNEQTVRQVLNKILEGQDITLVERSDKILLIPANATEQSAASNITISGYVKDSSSKEVLIGATVYIPSLNIGTTTNGYGYYSLTIPANRCMLAAAYTGYKQRLETISGTANQWAELLLSSSGALEEVKVTSEKKVDPDHVHLSAGDVTKYAALLGEPDIMRSLQNQAGVMGAQDGSTSLLVRGGDPGENLNLLDGVPLYYTDHFYGILSVFNTDALKSVDFYKGAFPARFGGRLSSIIDISTKDGDMNRVGGQVNLGLLNGSISLEGPVVKDKASFAITGRRSWVDLLWRAENNDVKLDFYDINAKANYIVNRTNRLYISIYNGGDKFGISDSGISILAQWHNTFIATKWTTIINPKLFINTTATYSRFKFDLRDFLFSEPPDSGGSFSLYNGSSAVKEASVKIQGYWYPSASHHVEAGVQYANSSFEPARVVFGDGRPNENTIADPFHANEIILYAEDEIKAGKNLVIRLGIHFANWFSEHFNYSSLQPRLYVAYRVAKRHTVYASATRMAQFIHLLNNNSSGFPTDFWLPSTARLKPETALMGTLGLASKWNRFSCSAEVYYKATDGLVTYNGGRNIFDNAKRWEDRLTQGIGWSYGAEFTVQQKFDKLAISLAYTLSWSWRQFDKLNGGDAFPYRYDRRHNLKANANYALTKRINAALSWTYMSGEAMTLPDQIYPDFDNNLLNGYVNSGFTYNLNSWNNYRLPAIHRLDVAVNFVRKRGKYFERTWTVGLYNAYGRRNIIGTTISQDEYGTYKLEGISVAQFIPALSYRIKF